MPSSCCAFGCASRYSKKKRSETTVFRAMILVDTSHQHLHQTSEKELDGNQMNIIEVVGITSPLVDRLTLQTTQISCQTSLYSARLRRKGVEIC